MTRVLFGFLVSVSLMIVSSALAGPERIEGLSGNGFSARGVGESPAQRASCSQQTRSGLFGWLIGPKEGNVDCAPSSASAAAAPLILGTGY